MPATQQQVLTDLTAAERDAGWLAACEEAGCHLVVTRELAEAVAELVRTLSPGPVLEVCAGCGELAAAVRRQGIDLTAADADPAAGSDVLRLDAAAALARIEPRMVIGCFVPVDSRVDQSVLATPSVEYYLVIAARINGQFSSSLDRSSRGWEACPLPEIARWVVTRHDTWLGEGRGVLRRGEARFYRRRRTRQ